MASAFALSAPPVVAAACAAGAARRPAARGASAAPRAAPRAAVAYRASRGGALATQRAALAGAGLRFGAAAPRAAPRRVSRAPQPAQAALDSVVTTLKSGPPAAKAYQAAAIAAAVLCAKLAWGARNGGIDLVLAAGYAVTAGNAHAIAASGGSPGSDTLKALNAGLVRARRAAPRQHICVVGWAPGCGAA
jgi:hypothetical protein